MSDERLRLMLELGFGFFIVLVYAVISLALAYGNVKEETSAGLKDMMEALKPIGILWAGYVFKQGVKTSNERPAERGKGNE